MEQGLAHIAGKTRYACNGGRPHEEQDLQNRLVPPPAPDVIEIQRVSSQIHHTCRHKQHQLDEGVVQHVQHRA
ncbi:Maff2 family, partial [Dysosmobacter welbionis]